MTTGQPVPWASVPTDDQVGFCARVIDDSGVAERFEALLARPTGRPRTLSVRALLVALFVLAVDDRPLHLTAATDLLCFGLSDNARVVLGVPSAPQRTTRAFLAAYRRVRYLFSRLRAVCGPGLVEAAVADLVMASVRVASEEELSGFSGSVGLDATPVPLWSRGPSGSTGRRASDPDGGWYVRQGDHREATGPTGKALGKLFWALEATIVTMGRGPGVTPAHPNLAIGVVLGRPGEDPAGTGVRVLARVREQGFGAGMLGADRGYTQGRPERFHLPVKALGYSLVMDYKEGDLGRQGSSQGAMLVDGAFYCPAMPEALVTATAERRAGRIDESTFGARLAARAPFRLVKKEGPDQDGYERFACPAQGERPHLGCPLRPTTASPGKIPVLSPPATPPKICTQTAVTIAPDVGARFRQDLTYGTETWRSAYASYRNTIEGTNGFLKDPAHEALGQPGRRRVRGLVAQSLFVAFLVMAANTRKIASFRQLMVDGAAPRVLERARRRRISLADYRPPS
ncbi:MAG TPA: hypothetical protein VE152_08965 [Acidimicrobiales bacterium]|nr:hypothetical protein [Acidimicrobiales bacterium]